VALTRDRRHAFRLGAGSIGRIWRSRLPHTSCAMGRNRKGRFPRRLAV